MFKKIFYVAVFLLAAATGALATPIEFHSDPGSPHTLYVNLTAGLPAQPWATYSVPVITSATWSDADQLAILQHVAAAYAPFNVDVTNIDPGALLDGHAFEIVVGGDGAWGGFTSYGGVTYTGSFTNARPNIGFTFPVNLGGDAHNVAESIIHEAGHGFGLNHQTAGYLDAAGVWHVTAEYAPGPYMGNSYATPGSGYWTIGRTPTGQVQDDFAVLTSTLGLVPEPGGFFLLAAAAAAMLNRRDRKRFSLTRDR